MGVACSRRTPLGWEKVQDDLEEAIRTGDLNRLERARRDARRNAYQFEDDSALQPITRSAEVELQKALRSGDPKLIEQACNEAEAQGVDKAKLSLGRAEARWLSAQSELNEAIRSGDAQRLEKAYRDADRAGVDAASLSKRPARQGVFTDGAEGLSSSYCGQFVARSYTAVTDFLTSKGTMCAAVAVLLFEWSTYNFVFLWSILSALGKDAFVTPFFLMFNTAWGLAVMSFLRAHLADPGIVPERWYGFCRRVGETLPVAP